MNAASATQLRLSAIVNRPTGGRWKKLNAAALASEVSNPSPSPQAAETSSTASRYTTLSDTAGATAFSGYTSPVAAATAAIAATIPSSSGGRSATNIRIRLEAGMALSVRRGDYAGQAGNDGRTTPPGAAGETVTETSRVRRRFWRSSSGAFGRERTRAPATWTT